MRAGRCFAARVSALRSADRSERIDAEDTAEAIRHRFGNVQGKLSAPRVTDYVRLVPADRIEDVSSVVESAKGVKDADMIAEFISEVRYADV